MPVTLLDLIVIGVMLISALLAMVRGFTREVLSVAAWVAAALAALLLQKHLSPYLHPYIKSDTLLPWVSAITIFVVTLLIVSLITIRISDMILDSRVGAIDRTFGFIFGAARGLLLAVVAFIFFNYLVPPKSEPVWVQDAKSRQFLVAGRDWLLNIMPPDVGGFLTKTAQDNGFLAPEAAPATQEPDPDAAGAPAPQTQPATPAPVPPAKPAQ